MPNGAGSWPNALVRLRCAPCISIWRPPGRPSRSGSRKGAAAPRRSADRSAVGRPFVAPVPGKRIHGLPIEYRVRVTRGGSNNLKYLSAYARAKATHVPLLKVAGSDYQRAFRRRRRVDLSRDVEPTLRAVREPFCKTREPRIEQRKATKVDVLQRLNQVAAPASACLAWSGLMLHRSTASRRGQTLRSLRRR